jgi:hypothetical protein
LPPFTASSAPSNAGESNSVYSCRFPQDGESIL